MPAKPEEAGLLNRLQTLKNSERICGRITVLCELFRPVRLYGYEPNSGGVAGIYGHTVGNNRFSGVRLSPAMAVLDSAVPDLKAQWPQDIKAPSGSGATPRSLSIRPSHARRPVPSLMRVSRSIAE